MHQDSLIGSVENGVDVFTGRLEMRQDIFVFVEKNKKNYFLRFL